MQHTVPLTICTVNYHAASLLELNFELASRLNPEVTGWAWLAVENTPPGAEQRLNAASKHFTVLPGIQPPAVPEKYQGSYQHGLALNSALQVVNTRFLLVMDPDFYVVRPGWMAELTQYMTDHDVSFLGAPWHPRWYRKYRYFPCVHFWLIDVEKVGLSNLDFTPDVNNNPARPQLQVWPDFHERLRQQGRPAAYGLLLRRASAAWREDRALRQLIGTSRDTGYHIYRKFFEDPDHRAEVVQPVFSPGRDELLPRQISRAQKLVLDHFWPDRMRYIPARRGYFTSQSLSTHGTIDLNGRDWEQFLWRGRPFGFHLRRNYGKRHAPSREVMELAKIVQALPAQIPGNASPMAASLPNR